MPAYFIRAPRTGSVFLRGLLDAMFALEQIIGLLNVDQKLRYAQCKVKHHVSICSSVPASRRIRMRLVLMP